MPQEADALCIVRQHPNITRKFRDRFHLASCVKCMSIFDMQICSPESFGHEKSLDRSFPMRQVLHKVMFQTKPADVASLHEHHRIASIIFPVNNQRVIALSGVVPNQTPKEPFLSVSIVLPSNRSVPACRNIVNDYNVIHFLESLDDSPTYDRRVGSTC